MEFRPAQQSAAGLKFVGSAAKQSRRLERDHMRALARRVEMVGPRLQPANAALSCARHLRFAAGFLALRDHDVLERQERLVFVGFQVPGGMTFSNSSWARVPANSQSSTLPDK